MRRKEKEIIAKQEIESLLRRALVCRLAMMDDKGPYMVPLCFGYESGSLYFHTAAKGKKLDILKKNNRVCFEVDLDCELKAAPNACEWSMNYKSVIGFGTASILADSDSKQRALNIIMRHYSGKSFKLSESKVKKTVIIAVKIESMTGKQSG